MAESINSLAEEIKKPHKPFHRLHDWALFTYINIIFKIEILHYVLQTYKAKIQKQPSVSAVWNKWSWKFRKILL